MGLLTSDPQRVLDEGAQLTMQAAPPPGTPSLGHITSAYGTTTLGRSIALAMLADGRSRLGETLFAQGGGRPAAVRVVDPVFLDPEGVRLNA